MMIDDDEVASSNWLERMVDAAETTGAEIVGGPVFPGLRRCDQARAAQSSGVLPGLWASGPVTR